MNLIKTAIVTLLSYVSFAQSSNSKLESNISNQKLILYGEYGLSQANYFTLADQYWYDHVSGFTAPADSLGFSKSNSSSFGIYINSTFKIALEKEVKISFLNEKKITSTIGLVMGIGSKNRAGLEFYKHTRELSDTLVSTQTGTHYYIYENKSEFRNVEYYSNTAIIGLKSMNRTNMNNRLNFGVGFEMMYGFSFNNTIVQNNGQNSYYENALPNMITDNTYNSSVYEGPFVQSFIFNFPIEIALRLQKKEGGFFENSAMTLNLNPNLNWSFIESTKNIKGTIGYGIGFRQVL